MAEQKTSWVNAKPEEVEAHVIELAKKGIPPQRIGLILRDEHGIPKAKLLGLKVKKILVKAKIWSDPEAHMRTAKSEKLQKHTKQHKHDYTALRSLAQHNHRIAKTKKR